ncbi:MAG TPA: M14 family metallopeptidase, partial [Bryobacteraceae bacterium]|nr:M14 family metallopeptidase [Bryobacteraceae bacterium]
KSSEGKPMFLAILSSPENLRNLERYREINRKLALGLASRSEAAKLSSEGEAAKLSSEGKVFVWIDSGLHASEVAPAQHAPELAYRMITDEGPEITRIRQTVILLQAPVINPDGLDSIAHWYGKNAGTPFELAPLPWLYQKYAGHDNNRDWFMMNLQETRNISKLLFQEWFPQIVYNQHQSPAFPARIFVPPYAEPLNPNIPAPVMEGINLIGSAMKERFARENKAGVLSYYGYDAWWNGGLRSVPAFHNMHGILTETALHSYATPRVYTAADFPAFFANGIPTKQPSVFYQLPWMGGKWGVRDAIEYMLTADFAILDLAASRSSSFLHKAWEMARNNIEAGRRGGPFAYVFPAEQWDKSSCLELLRRLRLGGINVQRARAPFAANKKMYPGGSYVIPLAQPFRAYIVDLLEPQHYPDLQSGSTGAAKRPYDVAGWTLPMQMNVITERVDSAFSADLEDARDIPLDVPSLDHRENSSFLTTIDTLRQGGSVRWTAAGKILTRAENGSGKAAYELQIPRVALYEPWTANMDTGWTQWVLDTYRVPYTLLHNSDMQNADLRSRFDSIILAAQPLSSILHGTRDGERSTASRARGPSGETIQRPEYTGGIEIAGLARLDAFVREGGTLIAFDSASDLPVQLFPVPLRNVIGSDESAETEVPAAYYCPGSILRVTVDITNPIAFGMPPEAYVFSSGGRAWDISLLPDHNTGDRQVRSVARYATRDLLASGWLSGEKAVHGRHLLIEARHGAGRVVLFGFRPQFRGQSFGTFKFLLNAVYLASAKTL